MPRLRSTTIAMGLSLMLGQLVAAASRDIQQFISRPAFGGGKTVAQSGSPQPQVPTACAAAWASYAAAKGYPVRPGTYYVKGQPWAFETVEITV